LVRGSPRSGRPQALPAGWHRPLRRLINWRPLRNSCTKSASLRIIFHPPGRPSASIYGPPFPTLPRPSTAPFIARKGHPRSLGNAIRPVPGRQRRNHAYRGAKFVRNRGGGAVVASPAPSGPPTVPFRSLLACHALPKATLSQANSATKRDRWGACGIGREKPQQPPPPGADKQWGYVVNHKKPDRGRPWRQLTHHSA